MTAASLLPLKISLGLIFLWIFVFWFWKDYRLDVFRENVFEFRDNLFMFASEGGVSFDHPAYRLLRHRLNVLLRYAHFFTFSKFFTAFISYRSSGVPEDREWQEALASLPSLETRKKFEKIHYLATFATIDHMCSRSLLLFLVSIPFAVAGATKRFMERHSRRAEKLVEELQKRAQEEDSSPTRKGDAVPVGAH
jgi:hypothetical protein